MDLLLLFSGSFITGLSGAMAPGPLLTITIAYSIKRGFKTGPLIVIGHGILEFLLLLFLIYGPIKILHSHSIIRIIFLTGGFILILMGMRFVISHSSFQIKEKNNPKPQLNSVVSGIVVTLSNPYWLIWWLTIGMAYIVKAMKYKYLGIGAFFLGHILADFSWYSFISFTFSKGNRLINQKIYQIIILICGVLIILFGVWFLYNGFMYKPSSLSE